VKRSVCLLGRDYPELGTVGFAALREGGALALSRGAQPKPYPHQDPNEDGALLVHTDQGVLLAVADGYNGAAACEIALAAAHEAAEALIASRGAAFRSGVAALATRIAERLPAAADRSRTCLVIARVAEQRCEFASFGDASLLRAQAPVPVSTTNELVLGRALDLGAVPAETWCGAFELAPGERLALVSDGVTNFAPSTGALAQVAAQAPSDLAAARALAELALRGGAGDNVAVCTYLPAGRARCVSS
jgi:serine/threonine protein phosphatase PrpC